MSIFSLNIDPFVLIFIELPTLIFVVSIILQIAIKKKLISIGIVFFGLLVATFTIFNSSFLIWCFVYTSISFIGTLIGDLMIKYHVKYANKKSLIILILFVLLTCIGYRLMIIGYVRYQWYKIDQQIENGEMKVYPDKK